MENGGQSWYNALALQVQKRFSHGLTGQVNYTWSHAIDDANKQGASWNISSTFNNATFNGNYPLDKGSSTLDQRHRLSVNWLWRPTFTTSTSDFAKYFVNGWELSGITTLASAHPVSATMNCRQHRRQRRLPGSHPGLQHAQRFRRLEPRSVPAGEQPRYRPDLQRRCPHHAQPSVRRTREGQPLV